MKKRRILSFLLAFSLLLSFVNLPKIYAQSNKSDAIVKSTEKNTEKNLTEYNDTKQEIDKLKAQREKFNSGDVRVIVELKEDSILDYANKMHKNLSEISETKIKENKEKIKDSQNNLINDLKKNVDIKDKVLNYDTVMNGVSFKVKGNDISKIEKNSNVKKVYISQEFNRPLLKNAQQIIGANQVWDSVKYKGEGTVVAVIDTGIDHNHSALKLDENAKSQARFKEEDIKKIIKEKNLKGSFYSEKIPYGYNYYDNNKNLFDSYGTMHGMHVSGIIGANDTKNNKYGVAPNAQILSLKVFSDDIQYPTTFTDIWLKALDDAIKLKADVINMSLGTAAGFSYVDKKYYPEAEMLKKAKDAGILISVASGNDGTITDGFYGVGIKPLESVYDTSEIANPAVDENSFAVASMENDKKYVYKIQWFDLNNGNGRSRKKLDKEAIINLAVASKDYNREISSDIVDLKKGRDLNDNQIKDKIALVEYPGSEEAKTFNQVLENIAGHSPKAIIMYKTEKQTDFLGGRITLTGKAGNLTVGIIKHSTYKDLISTKEQNKNFPFNLIIKTQPSEVENENKGKVSSFSSWGPTPDLRIKPEITAVGGNIYSLAEDEAYKNMSGTSMAAPQVAGASAIVKQYLKTRSDMPNDPDFIKLLLMNTATPISDEKNNYYFVRQQGAGKINLEKAISTQLTVKATGENDKVADGKLELRQIDKKSFNVELEIQNFSDYEKKVTISHSAIYEPISDGSRTQKPEKLNSSNSEKKLSETIPANSTKKVSFVADYSDSDLKENNFLEGFIKVDSDKENLVIPFLGFYGDWSNQRAIDAFAIPEYQKEKEKAQFVVNEKNNINSSAFLTSNGGPLPIIDNTVYLSPNSEYFKDVIARIAPLRNMEEIEFSILDADTKEVLRVLGKTYDVRKLSRLKIKNSFIPMIDSIWDGKIDGKEARAGRKYLYQIKAKLNNKQYGKTNTQVYQYPIVIDNLKPEMIKDFVIENIHNKERMKTIKFSAKDNESGIGKVSIMSLKYSNKVENIDKKSGLDLDKLNQAPGKNNKNKENKNPLLSSFTIENIKKLAEGFIGDKNLKTVKYGKNISIEIVDYEKDLNSGENLLKIEDGNKIKIPLEKVSDKPDVDSIIKVYRNGSTAKELHFEVPFYADRTHVKLLVNDYLGNSVESIKETGENSSYNTLNFLGYEHNIKPNAKLYIGNKEVNSPIYSSLEKELKVKIVFNKDNKYLDALKIREGKNAEDVIKDGSVNAGFAEKYKLKLDKNSKTVEFILNANDSKLEVYTTVKDGNFAEYNSNKKVKLSFENSDLSRFSKIKINNKEITNKDSGVSSDVTAGTVYVEMIFDKSKDQTKKINKVILKQGNEEKKLERTNSSFDVLEGKVVDKYSISGYSIELSLNLKQDGEIKFEYGNKYEDIPSVSPNINGHGHGHRHFDDDTQLINNDNSKKKYPAVFLETQRLLDVISNTKTIDDNHIFIKGFVGYVNSDDSVELVIISKLDNDGNETGKPVIITKDKLKKDDKILYANGNKNLYNGSGYRFESAIEVDRFNTNIQVKAVTTKNLESSIVRRVLFDNLTPNLSYQVISRNLESDEVTIKVVSEDNSLKLSLYHNDSLLDKIDKTTLTFDKPGVKIEKEYTFKLKPGQNEIKLYAKDLANYTTHKSIFIFRTFEEENKNQENNIVKSKDLKLKKDNATAQEELLNKELKEMKFNQKKATRFDEITDGDHKVDHDHDH
ncbi:S8 family serine peptidase [Helcococcus ovis]|uniref:S8 family serine peptidase n=1 Tax=Helcococcus ovis TaxID=72026 RepID=UPI0038BBD1FD